jgi:hypothetical protein
MSAKKRQRSSSAKRMAKLGLSVAYAIKTNTGEVGAEFAVLGSNAGRVIFKGENGRIFEVNEHVDESRHKPAPVMGFQREFLYAPIPKAVRDHNLGPRTKGQKEGDRLHLSKMDADYKRRNGLPRYEDPENGITIY